MLGTSVVDADGKDHTFYCMEGGVRITPSGCLVLQSGADVNGQILEGHIYAPGQWKEINVWKEEE